MSYLTAELPSMAAVAEDIAGIGSMLNQANAAAAGPTTTLAAAAADEVSAATAMMFSAFGQEYQAITKQLSVFHDQFAATLAAAGRAYAEAEAANAAAASAALGALTSRVQALVAPSPTPAAAAVSLVMGGSGLPIPPLTYVEDLVNQYVEPFTGFMAADAQALFTPEGLYPLTGIKDLTLSESVSRGVTILDDEIMEQLALLNTVDVVGYSQSAVIASLEMQNLVDAGVPTGSVNLTLLGDPMAPDGGLLSRFVGLNLPSIGLEFYGATPSDTGYPTDIFTLQYDGYASFPKFPINFLSDLNAFMGIQLVHGTYPDIDPMNLPPGYDMVQLPTSPGYSGGTDYYMITYPGLPLLEPVRAIPVLGNAVADLVEPNLTYLVNWGYGDPHYGYSTGYADVATPFEVIPPIPPTIGADLLSGAQQGVNAFVTDINTDVLPSLSNGLSSAMASGATGGSSFLPSLLTSAASTEVSADSIIQTIETLNSNITNSITNATAATYAVALPTADIVNALVTSVPSYNVNLFLDGIEQMIDGDPTGGLIYALGAPIAADTAILTLAAGFELNVILDAVGSVV